MVLMDVDRRNCPFYAKKTRNYSTDCNICCARFFFAFAIYIRHNQYPCRLFIRSRGMSAVVTHCFKREESIAIFRSLYTEPEIDRNKKRKRMRPLA